MNTIFAQDGSIVLLQATQQIYAAQANFESEKTGEPVSVYMVVAVPQGVSESNDDEKLILGMYDAEEACDEAFSALKIAMRNGSLAFEMPKTP